MHTSRLTTLLLIILSVSTASHASQNQQNENYYEVEVKDSKDNTRYLLIQQSIPVSEIRACMQQYELSYKMVHCKFRKKEDVSNEYCFDFPSTPSVHDTLSFQEFLDNHVSFPTVPSKTTKDGFDFVTNTFDGTFSVSNLQNNTTPFKQIERENIIQRVSQINVGNFLMPPIVLTVDSNIQNLENAVIVSPAQTKILNNNNLNDSDANIINTTNTNGRPKSSVIINNTSQNSNLNNNQNNNQIQTPLTPGKSKTKPRNNTKQNTINNNSNQAGIYILVVFGLIVCVGIVYAMIPSAPTPNSHKPNQDTPQQTS